MIRTNAESGQRIFSPETKIEWRGMATGMILEADRLGIPRSQLPKYDLPDWAMVASFLPGSDRDDKALTPVQISEKLAEHNIVRSRHHVARILFHMMNRQQAVHPHRRNIGKGCFKFVADVGGIKRNSISPEQSGLNYVVYAYYLGKPHDVVSEIKKAYGLVVRG